MPAPGCAGVASERRLLGRIDPVNLKHVLGDIQTDRGNLHLDGSPHVIRLRRSLYGTSMPGAGAVHHIKPGLRVFPLHVRLAAVSGIPMAAARCLSCAISGTRAGSLDGLMTQRIE